MTSQIQDAKRVQKVYAVVAKVSDLQIKIAAVFRAVSLRRRPAPNALSPKTGWCGLGMKAYTFNPDGYLPLLAMRDNLSNQDR